MIQRLLLKLAALLLTGELNSSKTLWLTLWATEGDLQVLHTLQSCQLTHLYPILVKVKWPVSLHLLFASFEPCMVVYCAWYAVVTSCVYTFKMFCRYGHNELDDPTITLPLSYQAVMDHPPVLQLYASKLDEQAVLKSSQVKALQVSSQVF